MKRLVLVLAALLALASPVRADVQLGLTTDLLNAYHPVTGVLGIEWRGLRTTLGIGTDGRSEASADLLFRHSDGMYAGIGLFAERADSYTESMSSDTTLIRPVKRGRGRGPKWKRPNTVISHTVVSIANVDYGLSPSLVLGYAYGNAFTEARVIFGGDYDMRGQYSLGVWW